MANVTFGRNAPTAYDIRMDRARAQTNTPSSVPTRRTAPGNLRSRVGGVGNFLGVLGTASLLAPVIEAGANAWTGFRKTPQGQLFTDRVGEALSAPARLVNSLTGGRNLLPSSSSGGVRLGQYNPPGFDPSRPVTGTDLVQSAQAVSKYFPTASVPSSGAAERAHQQELSRIAQLTAQDPELQRYERARSMAKTQEEMNAVRDEGMRIWAAKHGGLAAKVKPGSTGYEAIQGAINPATASFLNNEQVLGTQSFDPNTALSTAQQIQGQFRPNQALTDQEILAAQSYDPNIAMSSAGNIAFAPSSPAEAGMLKAVGGAQGEYITPMSTTTFANPLEQRKAIFQELLNRAGTRGR